MRRCVLMLALVLMLLPQVVSAHGGAFIINEAKNDFQALVSIAPAPLTVGLGDMSISVFAASAPTVLQVDQVRIETIAPDGSSTWYDAPWNEGSQSYDQHKIDLDQAGAWTFAVEITQGTVSERFEGGSEVGGTGLRLLSLLAYVLPLLLLIGLIGIAALRNRLVGDSELTEDQE